MLCPQKTKKAERPRPEPAFPHRLGQGTRCPPSQNSPPNGAKRRCRAEYSCRSGSHATL